MIETYRSFIEAGAAAVINCHTHCPGGVELWNGAPIFYSTGNFFFPKDLPPDAGSAAARYPLWWYGYVPKLYFDKLGVYSVEIMPFKFDRERVCQLNVKEKNGFCNYLASLTAKHGPGYLTWIRDALAEWPISVETAMTSSNMMRLRNIIVCEAHRDLVSCYMRLLEEGRAELALEEWPRIAAMQRPDWAEVGV